MLQAGLVRGSLQARENHLLSQPFECCLWKCLISRIIPLSSQSQPRAYSESSGVFVIRHPFVVSTGVAYTAKSVQPVGKKMDIMLSRDLDKELKIQKRERNEMI